MHIFQENIMHKNKQYKLNKYWYLGFLSVFGLPDAYRFLQGDVYSGWMLLWFLWLIDFIPSKK